MSRRDTKFYIHKQPIPLVAPTVFDAARDVFEYKNTFPVILGSTKRAYSGVVQLIFDSGGSAVHNFDDYPRTSKRNEESGIYTYTSKGNAMDHLHRLMELHSGAVTIVEDNARSHTKSATGSAEALPALWQFAKAHRRRPKSRRSQANTDRRWDAQETGVRSPLPTARPLKQSLPTPPLCNNASPTQPNSPKPLDRSCASPKCPRRQPSALIDRSPRKPERRKVSPPIGTVLMDAVKEGITKPSPASIMDIIPNSPIRRRNAIQSPLQFDYRDDTPAPSAKKTVLREHLAQAIHFFDLDSDSSSDEEQDSFGEAPRFPSIHAL